MPWSFDDGEAVLLSGPLSPGAAASIEGLLTDSEALKVSTKLDMPLGEIETYRL